jgi:hypothetical protein
MFVTFDSQVFRAVVEPSRHLMHPTRRSLELVHAAILEGVIQPVASEGIFTLEEVALSDRARFLCNRRSIAETVSERAKGNTLELTVSVGPDHSLHPGLSLESKRRFGAAIALGFRFLNIPRIGMVRPPELLNTGNYHECGGYDFGAFIDYSERFGAITDKIESHSVGFAISKSIGTRARIRAGYNANWCELLTDSRYFNDNERKEIGAAVSEWCDGDLVASHTAHNLTYICTEDRAGRRQRPSVFNRANRNWLNREHGVIFASLDELAHQLAKGTT